MDKETFTPEAEELRDIERVLAAVEHAYDEMQLESVVQRLREAIRHASEQARTLAERGTIKNPHRVDEVLKHELERALPPGVTLIGKGSQSHVFRLQREGLDVALKLFQLPGEGTADTDWSDLVRETLPDTEQEENAHKQAVCLELVSDMPSVARLVAFSQRDHVLVTDFIEGYDALRVDLSSQTLEKMESKLDDLVKTVMVGWRRGLVIDNKVENVRVTPEYDFKIVEFYDYRSKNDDLDNRLTQALTLLHEVTIKLFSKQNKAETTTERALMAVSRLMVTNGFAEEAEVFVKKYLPHLAAQ